MIKTVLLLLITAIPVIALGVWFIDYTTPISPDFSNWRQSSVLSKLNYLSSPTDSH